MPAGPPPHPDLVRALLDGECVIFVGAGLSRGAGLPDWGQLVGRMARALGVQPHDRLCVQVRLMCSAGVSPAGGRAETPVAWMAG